MLAVIRLVYAGFLYMGSDIFDKKSAAKEAIQNAIIGLLLLVTTFIILNQINPDILNLDVLKRIQSSESGTSAGVTTESAPNTQLDSGQGTFTTLESQAEAGQSVIPGIPL